MNLPYAGQRVFHPKYGPGEVRTPRVFGEPDCCVVMFADRPRAVRAHDCAQGSGRPEFRVVVRDGERVSP